MQYTKHPFMPLVIKTLYVSLIILSATLLASSLSGYILFRPLRDWSVLALSEASVTIAPFS